jgi:tRNA pseudouridine32 synthase/23S rRNA pseudouridine746 synthase
MTNNAPDPTLHFEQHLTVEETGFNAAELLSQATVLSKQAVKRSMQKGAVWLTHQEHTQRLRRASKSLQPGDQLHLYYDKNILDEEPTPAQLIADEGDYSVWYKPYGMYCQGSKWGDHCTITRWAEQHLTPQRSSFVVHRLDRAANGLIIVAHEKKAAALLSALFQNRKV